MALAAEDSGLSSMDENPHHFRIEGLDLMILYQGPRIRVKIKNQTFKVVKTSSFHGKSFTISP